MTRTIPHAIYRVVGLTGDGRTPPTLRCMIPLIFASRLLAFIGVAGIICVLLVRPLKTTGVVIFLWWLMTCFVTFLLNDPSAVMLLWPWQNKKSESIFQPRARRSSSFMRDRGDEIRIRCCCEDHNNYDTTYSSFIIHHSSYDTS